MGVVNLDNDRLPYVEGLNLQAWRIPLWEIMKSMNNNLVLPVSTSKPGESLCGFSTRTLVQWAEWTSLNLQAWRIPLWDAEITINATITIKSQPPSLENPFVGFSTKLSIPLTDLIVSTSKPGESLCGLVNECKPEIIGDVSTSKPGESLCGRQPHYNQCGSSGVPGLNLQAWRIPLWELKFLLP